MGNRVGIDTSAFRQVSEFWVSGRCGHCGALKTPRTRFNPRLSHQSVIPRRLMENRRALTAESLERYQPGLPSFMFSFIVWARCNGCMRAFEALRSWNETSSPRHILESEPVGLPAPIANREEPFRVLGSIPTLSANTPATPLRWSDCKRHGGFFFAR